LSRRLCREEGLEDASLDVLAHAYTGIGYGESHMRAALEAVHTGNRRFIEVNVRRGDDQFASVWHGIAGVGGKIGDHSLKLRRVGVDGAEGRIELQIQHDFLAHQAADDRFGAGNGAVQIEYGRLESLSASDGKQLLGQPGALQGGSAYGRKAIVHRTSPVGLIEKLRGMAEDYGEQVVEIVSHAGCHAPDPFQLLCLPDLCFDRCLTGDIRSNRGDAVYASIGVHHEGGIPRNQSGYAFRAQYGACEVVKRGARTRVEQGRLPTVGAIPVGQNIEPVPGG
jgi:hypothetical protein